MEGVGYLLHTLIKEIRARLAHFGPRGLVIGDPRSLAVLPNAKFNKLRENILQPRVIFMRQGVQASLAPNRRLP